MSDPRAKIANLWNSSSRFKTFGNALTKIIVRGVRCHDETTIDLRSPVTAFTGFNGTGKSTLLQLAASAYKSSMNLTINSFIRKGPLDKDVFSPNASFYCEYQDANGEKPLTLSYNATSLRWQGYPRRPEREVFFGGVSVFLPRSEQQDFVFRNSSVLKIGESKELTREVKQFIIQILSSGYDAIHDNAVSHRSQKDTVLSAKRNGKSYSEAHMGCGEGRIQCLVKRLECLPEKSLILLEEPEISLHAYAEYELGKYLLDLVGRRGHQILMTTHSSMLLRSLPDASLVYLARDQNSIKPLPGIGSRQAASLLTDGQDKTLTVLVEDDSASIVLSEILRNHDPSFLSTVRIAVARDKRESGKIDASGKDAIRNTMKTLSEAGLKIAAVLDGGEQADTNRYIFVLPGSRPPEAELYECSLVKQMLADRYKLNIPDLDGELSGQDCHRFFEIIGRKVTCAEDYLVRESAREYTRAVPASVVQQLVKSLKEAASRK
ncbi:MAG: ATP-dependent nuclease [Pirellula sp.]